MPAARRWPALFCLVALGLRPAPAPAAELWAQGQHRLLLDGSLKSFFVALSFAHRDDALRALLGSGPAGRGALAIADARLKLEGEHGEALKWELHYRLQPLLSSFAGARGAFSFAGNAQPPRTLPLQGSAFEGETFRLAHELDRLDLRLRLGKRLELTIGRQAVSFGVGFVWMPADLIGTFSPLELDREYKAGVDALRLNIALSEFGELALVGALGGPTCVRYRLPSGEACSPADVRVSKEHSLALARWRQGLGSWDLGLLAGYVRGDLVGGAFATAAIGNFRLRAEATVTHDLQRDQPDARGVSYAGSGNAGQASETFLRAVIGADYRFAFKRALTLYGELYYNGFGSLQAANYTSLAASPRVAEVGEIFNLGQVYLACGLSAELHEKLPLSVLVIANLADPSLQLAASLSYQLGDESDFGLGLQLPIGAASRLEGVVLRARSEFGLYPAVYYAMWRAYF